VSDGIETVDIIDPWLWSTLRSDATLLGMLPGHSDSSIISTLAVGGVSAPYVAFFCSSPRDILAVGGIRVDVEAVYTVKAVGEGASWNSVRAIARRIDFLLHGRDVDTPNGHISCRREMVIQYAEVDAGTQFRHLGGTFRIRAYSTP
jgi:hypothetical protein